MNNNRRRTLSPGPLLVLIGCLATPTCIAGQDKLARTAENALSRNERYQKEIDQNLARLRARYDTEQSGAAGVTRDSRYFHSYLQSLDRMERRLVVMGQQLRTNNCPLAHPRTKVLTGWMTKLRATMNPWREQLVAGKKKAEGFVDLRDFPNLEKDLARLLEIRDYCDNVRFDRPAELSKLRAKFKELASKYNEHCKVYLPFIEAKGKRSRIARVFSGTYSALIRANTKMKKLVADAPAKVRSALAEVQRLTKIALEKSNPTWLEGTGLRHSLSTARIELDLWAALAKKGDKSRLDLEANYSAATQALSEAVQSLIAVYRAPKDAYGGRDKTGLRKRVAAAWKQHHPTDTVLAIRFHSADWKRTKKMRWNGADRSYDLVDRSVLTVTVIVQTDAYLATTSPAFINRNNLDGEIVVGVNSKGSDYVHRRMLIKNL